MEFLKSARVVSALTLLSRIFGLVRDQVTTIVLGTRHSDVLFLAWTIPNLFRKLFGEGALSSAFIPSFVKVQGRGRQEELQHFVSNVISALFLVLVVLMGLFLLLLALLPDSWLLSLFQGDAEKMSDTLALARILIPYMVVSCVIAQFQGVLNSFRVFTIPALAPVVLNLVWIGAVVAAVFTVSAESGLRIYVIAYGILFAGLLQFLLFLPSLKKRDLLPKFRWDWKNRDFRNVMAMTAPMVLALSANQLNILVDRLVVQSFVPGDGGVTHLYLGNRLMQFPFALIGIALMTAVFPLLAKLSSEGNREGMKTILSDALRINLFLSIPALAGLVVLADPIISLLFEYKNFASASTTETCRTLVGYTVGMPFLSTVVLLTRAFYAMGRWKAPLYTGAGLVALNIVLDFVLVVPLGEAGVALATSITIAIQAIVLFLLLRSDVGRLGGRVLVVGTLKACALSSVMAAGVYFSEQGLDALAPGESVILRLMRVVLPIFIGLALFFFPARRLCAFEWRSLVEAFRDKKTAR
jgi:putative peptidoglycan lipid II flippase